MSISGLKDGPIRETSGGVIWHLAQDTAKILGVIFVIASAAVALHPLKFGTDSHPYWLTGHGLRYASGPMTKDAYLYSPAFADVIRPLTYLPWPVFAVFWSAALGVVLAWLLAPLRWWALPLWIAGLPEIIHGNVFILLAVVAAFGLQRRGLWAFAALTKITLCLGPVWFAVRHEWRELGISVGVFGAVALLSFAVEPHLWVEWIRFLASQAGRSSQTLGSEIWPPLVYRLPVAMLVVAWGAHTGRRWVIPVGMVLASPVLWLGTFTMLAALPRLQDRHRSQEDREQPAAATTGISG